MAQSGETAEDYPWASMARQLIANPNEPLPEVIAWQIRSDATRIKTKELWGRSINYDEMANGQIVDTNIIEKISALAGVEAPNGRIVHAGFEHTYGYLFSILKTSFGYKRARWVRPDIEDGFGLPRGTLGPQPDYGTLLMNVTYFGGRIASLNPDSNGVHPALLNIDYGNLTIERLTERVELEQRTIELRTDIVHFPNLPTTKGKNEALLVYAVADSNEPHAKLITLFPVDGSFATRIFDPKNLGTNKPITTRYNAYVEGLTGMSPSPKGSRTAWRTNTNQ
jgi:hypothetical protein